MSEWGINGPGKGNPVEFTGSDRTNTQKASKERGVWDLIPRLLSKNAEKNDLEAPIKGWNFERTTDAGQGSANMVDYTASGTIDPMVDYTASGAVEPKDEK